MLGYLEKPSPLTQGERGEGDFRIFKRFLNFLHTVSYIVGWVEEHR